MTTFLELTYSGLFFAVLAQQLGLPIPSVVFLMAAGALSAHGKMSPVIVVFLGVLGCLAGDGTWFWIGRKWGSKAMRLLCRFASDPRHCSRNAQEKFHRHGLPILCVAKFVPGLDAVLPPFCGVQGVSIAAFFGLDTIGSSLWASAYVGLGYVFSSELNIAIRWVQHFATTLGLGIGLPLAVYVGWRGLVLVRMIRELRLRRISPQMLAGRLKSDRKIAVLDLANFEDTDGKHEVIPGAFVVDPLLLRESPRIFVPDGIKIVLYSSSGSDMVSARAAVGLQRVGINKVWVLEGGLKAWREHGFPVSQLPEEPEAVAERYGIKLPAPATA